MRTVYRNPIELATCLKDIVETYLENLMSYEDMEQRIIKIINANEMRMYKNGNISLKLVKILDDSSVDIINKIAKDNNIIK